MKKNAPRRLFKLDSWSFINLLCTVWIFLQGSMSAVLAFELYDARNWVPNRASVFIDLTNLVLVGFALVIGLCVALFSFISKKARGYAILNLIASVILLGYLSGVLVSINTDYRPDVELSSAQEPARFRPLPKSNVTIFAAGDVSFDRRFEIPYVVREKSSYGNLPITFSWLSRTPSFVIPRMNIPESFGKESLVDGPLQSQAEPIKIPDINKEELIKWPFRHVKKIVQDADVAFVNLENPIANPTRFEPYRLTSESFWVKALSHTGIDIVNIANNHCFDAEEVGLLQTLSLLEEAGIKYTGVGRNLGRARRGAVTEINGLKIAWLGYTHKMARVTLSYAAARDNRVGCLPLDPAIIRQDIINARKHADVVIVTPHWGVANYHRTPENIKGLGRWMIDAGADAVLGQGPHLYQGIEVYKNKPIIYSMGTFVFGIWYKVWKDNIMVKLYLENGKPQRLVIIPIAGIRNELFQPYVLKGERANKLLRHMAELSKPYGTNIRIEGDLGIIQF
jgi:poly-gamma-glutamate synthesis protein (capsule biosynthesis protein)